MNFSSKIGKIVLVIVIVCIILTLYQTGAIEALSFENLQQNRQNLLNFVQNNALLSVLLFIVAYTVSVGLSLPGATILTLTGGFLFGIIGLIYVVLAATLGAIIAFLASRFLIGNWVQKKFSKFIEPFNKALEENGVSYLLFVRLVPVFPFFLINILAGLTKVKLRTFALTTAVGIIPGTLAYVFAGTQLATISSPKDILSPGLIGAFVLLGLVSMIPVIIKKPFINNLFKKRL